MNTIKIETLTEEEFKNKFIITKNHFDKNASFDGFMFETYGQELDYVFEMSKKKRVITILEGDEGIEKEETFTDSFGIETKETFFYPYLYFTTGFHYVNRLGFFVLDKPYEFEFEVKVD